ncbi:MAG: cyclic nucleotide-binding domain-containing protein [Pseudomonadota bacterium]|nr:cyclic nucleotide-binding domain-containing protein [Pseudomonadota bacterium]
MSSDSASGGDRYVGRRANGKVVVLDRRVHAADTVVFRQGDQASAAYLVQSGQVEIYEARRDGDHHIAWVGAGELFGEMALIDKRVRSASARTVGETILIPVNESMLDGLLAKADPALRGLVRILVQRLRETTARVI